MLKKFSRAVLSRIFSGIKKDKGKKSRIAILLGSYNSVSGFVSGNYKHSWGEMFIIAMDNPERERRNDLEEKMEDAIKEKEWDVVIFYAGDYIECQRKSDLFKKIKSTKNKFLFTCECDCDEEEKEKITSRWVSFKVECGGKKEMGLTAGIIKSTFGVV